MIVVLNSVDLALNIAILSQSCCCVDLLFLTKLDQCLHHWSWYAPLSGMQVNSEGFLAEVFHPWVRWEGPGSGFENSSGAGVWVGPSWAQVGGPTWVGPSRAQVGGPRIRRFGSLGIEVEKQGFRAVRLITGQKFPQKNLKSGSSLLTFRGASSNI